MHIFIRFGPPGSVKVCLSSILISIHFIKNEVHVHLYRHIDEYFSQDGGVHTCRQLFRLNSNQQRSIFLGYIYLYAISATVKVCLSSILISLRRGDHKKMNVHLYRHIDEYFSQDGGVHTCSAEFKPAKIHFSWLSSARITTPRP
jgi:hypothetical protein